MATTRAKPTRRTTSEFVMEVPSWFPRLPGWAARVPQWAAVSGFMVVLCAASLYVRTYQMGYQFWMDEAITVGIASHHLTAIPGVLRMDGSPPLFYMLLHFWMAWFGDSALATHALNVLIAMLSVPIGLWAAWSLFGRRAGLIAAVLFAFNAFITVYGTETRMYELMTLLGLLATVSFLHGFVYRRRRYVAMFTISEALMLYTHAWALFFGAASAVAVLLLYRIGDEHTREHLIKDAVLAYVGAGILFLPWLPTFIFQSLHTAAPWDSAPQFGAPVQLSRNIMGGDRVTAAVVGAAAFGLAPLFVGRARRTSREAQLMWVLITLATVTLMLAWIASHITPAWVPRYFAPVVPSILLLAAMGMARAGAVGFLGIVLYVIFLIFPGAYTPLFKSNMQNVGAEMGPLLQRGALVVSAQPEQTPLAYYYLPKGLRYGSVINGRVLKDPTFMDWVNALKRFRAALPDKVAPKLLADVKPGQQLLFIRPLTEGGIDWAEGWTWLVRRRAAQWTAIIQADKQFKRVAYSPHYYPGACCVADSAVLYEKVS